MSRNTSMTLQNVDAVVDRVMAGGFPLAATAQDRGVMDPLVGAWQGLAPGPVRDAIGPSVARYLVRGTTEQRGWVLSFFSRCPLAAGGEALAQRVRDGAEGFDSTTSNPISGLIGGTLREALLYTAVSWRDGEAVDEAVLSVVREDILTGDGESLLFDAYRHSPEWAVQHEATFVALYPHSPSAVFKARVQRGLSPLDVLDELLAVTTEEGRLSLHALLTFNRRLVPPAQRTRLLARLA